MAYDTAFYIFGSCLAALAVITAFVGLRFEKFPGKAMPLVVVVFAVLIGVSTTFAVLNGQDEEKARASEQDKANNEAERLEGQPLQSTDEESTGSNSTTGKVESGGQKAPVSGPGGTVKLEASPTDIAYDTTKLHSQPGHVTIEFTNPATLEHNVVIEQEGKELGASETIAQGKTSVSADLPPGAYTFFCSVPGHRKREWKER